MRTQELLKGRFKKAESHFSAFASHYNQLAQWIATEVIVQDKDIARRTQAVRAALMLADVCTPLLTTTCTVANTMQLLRSQFDFSAAYAVVGGLSHAAVTRLTKTWAVRTHTPSLEFYTADPNTYYRACTLRTFFCGRSCRHSLPPTATGSTSAPPWRRCRVVLPSSRTLACCTCF